MSEQVSGSNRYSPVFAYQKQLTMIDFRGHLSALFFTSGCNFRCGFCHNAELMASKQNGFSWERLERLCINFKDNWADAITITGGEPMLQKALPELIEFFRNYSFAIKVDTNGSCPRMLQTVLPIVDYIALDVKSSLGRYSELTGYDKTSTLKESINLLKSAQVDYEFRTTIIESFHTESDIKGILKIINGAKRYVLQPFVPQPHLPERFYRQTKRTSPDTLKKYAKWAESFAEKVIISGNE
jgi:pyruvate formate lyase activating enzyme